MFDIGWVEMMVVIVVMIVVIGPKDLPVVLHTIGRWIAQVRGMARGFQDSIEEMAQEAGLDQMRDEMTSIRDFSLEDQIEKAIDPEDELKEGISGESTKAIEYDKDDAPAGETQTQNRDLAATGDKRETPSADEKPKSKPKTDVPAPGEKA